MQPGPAMDLADRQAAHEVQPPDLRPLLHSDHPVPPELALCANEPRLRGPPDAQAVQFSPGGDRLIRLRTRSRLLDASVYSAQPRARIGRGAGVLNRALTSARSARV